MSNLLVQNIKHTNNTTAITVDSSAQMTVKSDGGATTTSLQQGLNKAFISHNSGSSIRDSFNVGSLTDSGTGDYKTNFTNSFSNNDYIADGISCNFTGTLTHYWVQNESDYATTDCELKTLIVSDTSGGGNNTDSTLVNTSFSGDLA